MYLTDCVQKLNAKISMSTFLDIYASCHVFEDGEHQTSHEQTESYDWLGISMKSGMSLSHSSAGIEGTIITNTAFCCPILCRQFLPLIFHE